MSPYWNINWGFAGLAALLTLVVLAAAVRQAWARLNGKRTRGAVLLVALALACFLPTSNWILLEPLSQNYLTSMAAVAKKTNLIGRSQREISELYGEPRGRRSTNGAETWYYTWPPGYLFASNFEVHFRDGKVASWEAFDD